MEDWEDAPVEPVLKKEPPIKGKWDDEDMDDDDVKDSWEDEDALAQAPLPEPPVTKSASKSMTKGPEKKGKLDGKAAEVPLDPVAEKLHQQRLVEEADYKSTAELFAKKEGENSIENFIPKSESDFMEYAELVSYKLRTYEAVMRLSMTSLKAADAKEIASSITALANEKLKAEKEATAGKKKTGGKKKQLHVDKPDDAVVDAYDALDDYDFM